MQASLYFFEVYGDAINQLNWKPHTAFFMKLVLMITILLTKFVSVNYACVPGHTGKTQIYQLELFYSNWGTPFPIS